jgi:hypothetical protein
MLISIAAILAIILAGLIVVTLNRRSGNVMTRNAEYTPAARNIIGTYDGKTPDKVTATLAPLQKDPIPTQTVRINRDSEPEEITVDGKVLSPGKVARTVGERVTIRNMSDDTVGIVVTPSVKGKSAFSILRNDLVTLLFEFGGEYEIALEDNPESRMKVIVTDPSRKYGTAEASRR